MSTEPPPLERLLDEAEALRDAHDHAHAATEGTVAIFAFRIGELRLGIAAGAVHSVIGGERPTKLPLAPAHVRGLIAYRDGALAIVDLSAFLGLGATPDESMIKGRVLVVQHREYEAGFVCDHASGVQVLPSNALEDTLVIRAGRVAELTRYECSTHEGRMAVLDLDRLFDAARVRPA